MQNTRCNKKIFFKLLELEFNIFDKNPDSHLQTIRQVEDAVAQEYSNPAWRQDTCLTFLLCGVYMDICINNLFDKNCKHLWLLIYISW